MCIWRPHFQTSPTVSRGHVIKFGALGSELKYYMELPGDLFKDKAVCPEYSGGRDIVMT